MISRPKPVVQSTASSKQNEIVGLRTQIDRLRLKAKEFDSLAAKCLVEMNEINKKIKAATSKNDKETANIHYKHYCSLNAQRLEYTKKATDINIFCDKLMASISQKEMESSVVEITESIKKMGNIDLSLKTGETIESLSNAIKDMDKSISTTMTSISSHADNTVVPFVDLESVGFVDVENEVLEEDELSRRFRELKSNTKTPSKTLNFNFNKTTLSE